jgi:hypothetical protein
MWPRMSFATLQLLNEVRIALKESGGASSDYQEEIAFLETRGAPGYRCANTYMFEFDSRLPPIMILKKRVTLHL